ncbi:hypothetical protein HLH44_17050 [Gluconacetobacter sp. 1c LMG 22058]|uniref:Uncharacterized protein n=1 Tax=Gluconacetobacter dulcium TaxID=2729096 RepID=A0A7W4K2E7_9PROT|nr:hypothetical protein [Gluconacetobacter dulcium]MBB2199130.1 hypothetical protein [Gluconacetobacter dulcium]
MEERIEKIKITDQEIIQVERLISGRDGLRFHPDRKVAVPVSLIELRWHVATETWLALVQVTVATSDYPQNEVLTVPIEKLTRHRRYAVQQ